MDNKKSLSIIIPFYGQKAEELLVPLKSISMQEGISFDALDVHLVNDGGPEIDEELLKRFENLNLTLHTLSENGGVGPARQYGIDHSEGEWFMFIDADDRLYSPQALWHFFSAASSSSSDTLSILTADFYVELGDKGPQHIEALDTHSFGGTVYSKWFRRSYIEELGLKFPPDLPVFEDTYFLSIALKFSKGTVQLPLTEAYYATNRQGSLSDESEKWSCENYVLGMYHYLLFIRSHLSDTDTEHEIDEFLLALYNFMQTHEIRNHSLFNHNIRSLLNLLPGYRIKYAKLSQALKQHNFPTPASPGFKEFLETVKSIRRQAADPLED